MKIFQTFAQFDENGPYMQKMKDKQNVYLNFYSFLLSYLTLNKYYGSITMYCNQKAYDTFIKYIPYDEIIIKENKNDFFFWNMYKIDMMKLQNEDFIHVDSDVFIFDDLFKNFIDGHYDMMVQDYIPPKKNFVKNFYWRNRNFLTSGKLSFSKSYDNKCMSCGSFGIKKEIQNEYFNIIDIIHHGMKHDLFVASNCPTMILEELMAHLYSLKYKFNVYDILPYDLVLKYGVRGTGDIKGYTHVWTNSKFHFYIIKLIKNKIKKEFPEKYDLVEFYEKEILNKII